MQDQIAGPACGWIKVAPDRSRWHTTRMPPDRKNAADGNQYGFLKWIVIIKNVKKYTHTNENLKLEILHRY